jgi:hypothetical protein
LKRTPHLFSRADPGAAPAVDPYLRMAMYNAFANLALILFGVILFGLYLLLKDFLQPLLWAGLCAVLLKGEAFASATRKLVRWSDGW